MGYDPARFLTKVDNEFICAICALVIESPLQTPCEHLFCNKCIKDWLEINRTCPVDKRPLTTNDLRDPNRILRNLLNNLDIKCDFHQDGCETITQLEYSGQHVNKCEYNLDGEVVCDKGCNNTMTRRDYQNNNCFHHNLAEDVTKLRHELNEQKNHFGHLASEVKKLRHELSEQNCLVQRQTDEIRKLRDELKHHKELVENSNLNRQKMEIAELCVDFLLSPQPEWQQIRNMKFGPMNLLEIDKVDPAFEISSMNLSESDYVDPSFDPAYVQSAHTLTPTNACFKVYFTTLQDVDGFFIGLTRRGYFSEWLSENENVHRKVLKRVDSANHFLESLVSKNGDVIECGIEFPNDFTNDGKHRAQLYVSVNEKLISKRTYVIPDDGFYPTIILYLHSTKVRYCQRIS